MRLLRARRSTPQRVETAEGTTENLHKTRRGGWAHVAVQQRTEENWKRNQAGLAGLVDEVDREERPELIVLSGDGDARRLLIDQLGESARAKLVEVPVHTGADGSDSSALEEAVGTELERLGDERLDAVEDRLREDGGRRGAHGVTSVVEALQRAEVETLVLCPESVEDRALLALDGAPWVAHGEDDSFGAGVLGSVPATAALVRAAIATDAEVIIVDEPLTASGVSGALRWAAA